MSGIGGSQLLLDGARRQRGQAARLHVRPTPIRERAAPSGSTVQVAAMRKKPEVASIEIERGGSDAVIRPERIDAASRPDPTSESRIPPSAVGSARTTPGSQAG